MTRRIAFMDISPDLLASLLCLPAGVNVLHAASQERKYVNVEPDIRITIEGGDLPEVESGCRIPQVSPMYRTTEKYRERVVEFASWGNEPPAPPPLPWIDGHGEILDDAQSKSFGWPIVNVTRTKERHVGLDGGVK